MLCNMGIFEMFQITAMYIPEMESKAGSKVERRWKVHDIYFKVSRCLALFKRTDDWILLVLLPIWACLTLRQNT